MKPARSSPRARQYGVRPSPGAVIVVHLLFAGCLPHFLAGQASLEILSPLPDATGAISRVDSLFEVGSFTDGLARLEGYLAVYPEDVEARWRAARAATTIGVLMRNARKARPFYRAGIAHADIAVNLAPNNQDALTWSMVSKGRLAIWTGARETARLAQDVWSIYHRLIAENEGNALAHHALGELHYRVKKLSRVKRFLARTILGGEPLSRANWEGAFSHLSRAVELEPNNKMFRLSYAQALENRGRYDESIAQVESALARPVSGRLDGHYHRLIEKWARRFDESNSSR